MAFHFPTVLYTNATLHVTENKNFMSRRPDMYLASQNYRELFDFFLVDFGA